MAKRLFVGNLPWSTTEESLREVFAQAGEVEGVIIPLDRETKRPRGFAFVDIAEDAAAGAIERFHGSDFGGRAMTVNEAKPREERVG